MCSEKRIDDLMESGTLALKSDFDPIRVQTLEAASV